MKMTQYLNIKKNYGMIAHHIVNDLQDVDIG